jgi:hypothetical protein
MYARLPKQPLGPLVLSHMLTKMSAKPNVDHSILTTNNKTEPWPNHEREREGVGFL